MLIHSILPNSIDGFKYILINNSLTLPQAQVYCLTVYENGSLCGFESNNAVWMHVFDAVNAKPNTIYWTERDHRNSRTIAGNLSLYLENKVCYGAMYDNETKIKPTARSCCEAHHFICQTVQVDSGIY